MDSSVPNIKSSRQRRPQTAQLKATRKIQIKERENAAVSRLTTPRTARPSDSMSYVGFKPTEMRSQSNLQHNRNMIAIKKAPERAINVLQYLDQWVANIDVKSYPAGTPTDKLEIVKKLIEAHNFAWNEITLQVKEFSDEHAMVFAKLKQFYNSLLEEYPKLVRQFCQEISSLKEEVAKRDQQIEALQNQLVGNEDRCNAAGNLVFGLQKKLKHVTDRKKYYKSELRFQVTENERLTEEMTALKCNIARREEAIDEMLKKQHTTKVIVAPEANEKVEKKEEEMGPVQDVEYKCVGVNTTALEPYEFRASGLFARTADMPKEQREKISVVKRTIDVTRLDLTNSKSEDAFNLPWIQEKTVTKEHSPLRSLVYRLMQMPVDPVSPKLTLGSQAELRKFAWVYAKIISIFAGSVQIENPATPYKSFEDVVVHFMNQVYQTPYLATQMAQSLIQSANILEKIDPAMMLFGMFYKGQYDLPQYRFFNLIMEISIGDVTPSLYALIKQDSLTSEETVINISTRRAAAIYEAIFPFDDVPPELSSFLGDISYWDFMHICIKRFDTCRQHLWRIMKVALCLSDCPDVSRISYHSFILFCGLTFPQIQTGVSSQYWKELIRRSQAKGKRSDDLDFESVAFLIVGHEELFFEVMNISPAKDFHARFDKVNAAVLKCVNFILKRLIYYIPELKKKIPNGENTISASEMSMRTSLFLCDISDAFAYYRMILHLIDGIYVRDFTRMRLSDNANEDEAKAYIQHFVDREKVVGIQELPKE